MEGAETSEAYAGHAMNGRYEYRAKRDVPTSAKTKVNAPCALLNLA